MTQTITVIPNPDSDDCMQAAVNAYVADHPETAGWDLHPRWEDDERDAILLDVPDPAVIEVCDSPEGPFLRARCADGERDITPHDDRDLDDPDTVRFEVQHDLVGGWGESVDWNLAEVVDRR